ncbi:MAG: hypothetical protein AABM67_10460 [Acidobacteriota bacterium]
MAEMEEPIRLRLVNKCAELERKKNLFASRPPGATFRELLDLEREIAGLKDLIEDRHRLSAHSKPLAVH